MHVVNLTLAPIMAFERLLDDQVTDAEAINFVMGLKVSEQDIVKSFTQKQLIIHALPNPDHRAGDVATHFADPSKVLDVY